MLRSTNADPGNTGSGRFLVSTKRKPFCAGKGYIDVFFRDETLRCFVSGFSIGVSIGFGVCIVCVWIVGSFKETLEVDSLAGGLYTYQLEYLELVVSPSLQTHDCHLSTSCIQRLHYIPQAGIVGRLV